MSYTTEYQKILEAREDEIAEVYFRKELSIKERCEIMNLMIQSDVIVALINKKY